MEDIEYKIDNDGRKYTNHGIIPGIMSFTIINPSLGYNDGLNYNGQIGTASFEQAFNAMQNRDKSPGLSLSKMMPYVNYICVSHGYSNIGSWYGERINGSGPSVVSDRPACPKGQCTNGPSTWYAFCGTKYDLRFWSGPNSATADSTTLDRFGLKIIWKGYPDEESAMSSLVQVGDICTMYVTGPSAHACMWTGQDWRSDFIQKRAWVYQSRPARDYMLLWRHPDMKL